MRKPWLSRGLITSNYHYYYYLAAQRILGNRNSNIQVKYLNLEDATQRMFTK